MQRPTPHIRLRPVAPDDLPALYQQQLDPEANRMAGTKPRSREVFHATWQRIFTDPSVIPRVILHESLVVGGISCFKLEGLDNVGYWIAREHWGKGIASPALTLFLDEVKIRPLHATAAATNAASIHILKSRGFQLKGYRMGEETDRFTAREIADFVLP